MIDEWKSYIDSQTLTVEAKVISLGRRIGRNTLQLVDRSALEARLAPRRNHFSQSPARRCGANANTSRDHEEDKQPGRGESLVEVANSLAYTRTSSRFCHRVCSRRLILPRFTSSSVRTPGLPIPSLIHATPVTCETRFAP